MRSDRIPHWTNRIGAAVPVVRGWRSGVGVVEGWRGSIVHRVETDGATRITRSKIVDPSWFNWPALPVAMADTIVPDFPRPTRVSICPTPATISRQLPMSFWRRGGQLDHELDLRGCLKTVRFGRVAWSWS